MQKILPTVFILLLPSLAFAQFENLTNKFKSNTSLVQQENVTHGLMKKVQSVLATFTQLPLDSNKLEIIKKATPLLTQAKGISAGILKDVLNKQPADMDQTNTISGLLDQVKELMASKPAVPSLSSFQTPEAIKQSLGLKDLLTGIFTNESDVLKALISNAHSPL